MWAAILIAGGALHQPAAFAAAPPAVDVPAKLPNILFFLADDQRHDTLGCAGHPVVRTPAIDQLAAQGYRFEQAFVTTSICAASRASILCGRHERTHGYTFSAPPVSAAHTKDTYPVHLRAAGYQTGFVGKLGVKWKEGQPKATARMFDSFNPLGRSPYFHPLPDGTQRHETDLAADHAIAFIRESQATERPFALSVSFNAPHAEDADRKAHYPPPPGVAKMYKEMEIPLPRLSDPAIFDALPEFLQQSMNRHRYFWRWDTPEKYQRNMRNYYRMLTGIDQAIARVVNELKALELDDQTIIIYMADNGYYMGDRGLAGKWTHFEESLHVPLIIYDPRIPATQRGQTGPAMALNIDIAPTILSLAGLPIPEGYQGASLMPWVQGKKGVTWRDSFFCEHLMEHRDLPKWEGVRDARYMYARYFDQQPAYEFLHDLKKDPDELNNVATTEAYREVLAAMRKRCDTFKTSYESAK